MEYIKAVIGGFEMYVPANDRLGELLLLAQRRFNYQKHISKMRKEYKGKIESEVVVMDSDYIYALEDVMEEKGYGNIIHRQIQKSPIEEGKILYDLFRDNKSLSYLIEVCAYPQEQLQKIIRNFFETFKKIIF